MGGGYLCTFEFGSVVSGSRSTLRCMYICVFVLFSHTIRHYPVYKRLSSEIERVESWHLAVCLVFVRLTFYFVGDKLHVHIFIQLCRHSVMAHQSDPQILFGDDRSRWNFLPSFFSLISSLMWLLMILYSCMICMTSFEEKSIFSFCFLLVYPSHIILILAPCCLDGLITYINHH